MKRGFTLSELLLAAAIFAFVITALLGFFVSCIFLNETSRNLTIAASHAQFALEEIKNTPFANIQSINWDSSIIVSKGLTPLPAERIAVAVSGTEPLDIVVAVNWQDRGLRARGISLETLVTEP
jgi:prepilin-type N-terminal cleavage/methylation domain-containing protein